jgi:hypothetical protein
MKTNLQEHLEARAFAIGILIGIISSLVSIILRPDLLMLLILMACAIAYICLTIWDGMKRYPLAYAPKPKPAPAVEETETTAPD